MKLTLALNRTLDEKSKKHEIMIRDLVTVTSMKKGSVKNVIGKYLLNSPAPYNSHDLHYLITVKKSYECSTNPNELTVSGRISDLFKANVIARDYKETSVGVYSYTSVNNAHLLNLELGVGRYDTKDGLLNSLYDYRALKKEKEKEEIQLEQTLPLSLTNGKLYTVIGDVKYMLVEV